MSEIEKHNPTAIEKHNPAVVDEDAKVEVKYLSTLGNVFTCGNDVFKGGIDMIILEGRKTRSWFSEPYVQGEEQFPACFSVGGKFPSKNSPEPQAETCDTCPKSQWQGRESPECKERRKLVGLKVEDKKILPALYSFLVFPTSVSGTKAHPGGWKAYLSKINLADRLAKEEVITHIDIESNAPKPGAHMVFKNVGLVKELGVDPEVLKGFQGMAKAEADFEPVKVDEDAEVEAKAAQNAGDKPKDAPQSGKAAPQSGKAAPTGAGKKF